MTRRAAFLLLALASLAPASARLHAQAGAAPSGVVRIADAMRLERRPDTITIAGRATVRSGLLHHRALDVALDDGTGGIRLFKRNARVVVDRGDSVVATGVVRRYRGGLELDAVSVAVVEAPKRDVEPLALTSTHVDSVREGRLIRVRGVAGASGHSEGGVWMVLRSERDAAVRDSLTLWVAAAHADPSPLEGVRSGDRLEVTGIVSAFQDNPSEPRVWQLLPRDERDVHILGVPKLWMGRLRIVVLGAALFLLTALLLARLTAHRHKRRLAEVEARYEQLLALSPDAVVVHAGGLIRFANPAAARLLGVADAHALVEQPIARHWPDFADGRAARDGGAGRVSREVTLAGLGAAPGEAPGTAAAAPVRTQLVTAHGEKVDVEATASPCRFHDRDATVVLARDVRPQLRHERELRALAQLDELTGLFNRRGFQLHAETLRREQAALGRPVVLVLADLDRLKSINDTWGHAVGDAALRVVADTLRATLGGGALVARWGGDEYTALVTPPSDDPADVKALGDRVQQALDSLVVAGADRMIEVTASVGVALLRPGGAAETAEALAVADTQLYERKRARAGKA